MCGDADSADSRRQDEKLRYLPAVCVPLDRSPNTASTAPGCHPTRRRSEEHTSELQSPCNLVCRLLLEKKEFRTTVTQELAEMPARPPSQPRTNIEVTIAIALRVSISHRPIESRGSSPVSLSTWGVFAL